MRNSLLVLVDVLMLLVVLLEFTLTMEVGELGETSEDKTLLGDITAASLVEVDVKANKVELNWLEGVLDVKGIPVELELSVALKELASAADELGGVISSFS